MLKLLTAILWGLLATGCDNDKVESFMEGDDND